VEHRHRWWTLAAITVATFTVASLLAGLSADGAILILSRAMQGVGAALLVPIGLALLRN